MKLYTVNKIFNGAYQVIGIYDSEEKAKAIIEPLLHLNKYTSYTITEMELNKSNKSFRTILIDEDVED